MSAGRKRENESKIKRWGGVEEKKEEQEMGARAEINSSFSAAECVSVSVWVCACHASGRCCSVCV